MKCALCGVNEANKKNTHFLTDGIIRTSLNEDGENVREKGFYFDVSNDSAFVEFNFQRRTTFEKLTSTLGREPNESEIEKAKQIPFSVDNVFCSECEEKFTVIETNFQQKYLHLFRQADLTGKSSVILDDYKLAKSFFLLQVWRTSICDDIFKINDEVKEALRLIILNNENVGIDTLFRFPLAVTYLITEDRDGGYTANFVGYTDDRNPSLILMNDFVIQFYENEVSLRFFDFYKLNDENDYTGFLNLQSNQFLIKILNHEQRLQLLKDFITNDKVEALVRFYSENFSKLWLGIFSVNPSPALISKYLTHLIQGSETNLLHYTKENIFSLTSQFIANELNGI